MPIALKQLTKSFASWFSAHPRVLIGLLLVLLLGPFTAKPVQVDDPLFVWTGQWIAKHPLNFFGGETDFFGPTMPMWKANWNPPLFSYFLAGVGSIFGWRELVLHLFYLPWAVCGVLGVYALAQRWCERPLVAALAAALTPAFLISATTLMCDVMMLSLWTWSVVLWDKALDNDRKLGWFLLAGLLAGLAILTKYTPVTLLPLFPIMALLRTGRCLRFGQKPPSSGDAFNFSWLLGLAVPLLMVAAYEMWTRSLYGQGLLSHAGHGLVSLAGGRRDVFLSWPGGWPTKVIVSLAFAGAGLLPVLLFAPMLWRRSLLLTGGAVTLGLSIVLAWLWNSLMPTEHPNLLKNWAFMLQVVLYIGGGLHLLVLTLTEVGQRRDPISLLLALWVLGGLFCATALNFTINVRALLPILPAVAILLARRLEAAALLSTSARDRYAPVWPLLVSVLVSLGVAQADYVKASSDKSTAEALSRAYWPQNHQLWFTAGAKFYLEGLGAKLLDVERSRVEPGDVILGRGGAGVTVSKRPLPEGSVGFLRFAHVAPPGSWFSLHGNNGHQSAGFYIAGSAPVPFVIGSLPAQDYLLLKVYVPLQYCSRPTNPREVQAAAMPDLSLEPPRAEGLEDEVRAWVNKAAAPETQLGIQLQSQGKLAEAITHYRRALSVQSNNVTALNNLALILATSDKPELRDPRQAVQLASQAVNLTQARWPGLLGTLAAAHARAGQFAEAAKCAQTACVLAGVTGQREMAFRCAEQQWLYAQGRVATR